MDTENLRVVMPTLLLPVAPEVVFMTTSGATSEDKLVFWQLSVFTDDMAQHDY